MKDVLQKNWKSLLIAVMGIGFSINFLCPTIEPIMIVPITSISDVSSYGNIANGCIKIDYDGNLISSPSDCSKVSGVIVDARIPER